MKKFNHAYAIITGLFLTLLIHPISVMCFQAPDQDLVIKFLRISSGCTVDLLRKKVPLVTRQVPENYRDAIVTPGPNQEQLVKIAFSAMPEFVCKAVNKVVFVNHGGGANARVNSKYPDLLIVSFPTEDRLAFSREDRNLIEILRENSGSARDRKLRDYVKERLEEAWPAAIKTILHEATHSAVNLLEKSKTKEPKENYCSDYENNWVSRGIDGIRGRNQGFKVQDADYHPDFWETGAKGDAKTIIEKTGLQEGLYNEWCRMQKQFVEAKMSEGYDLDTAGGDDNVPPMKGFFSDYGQNDPAEDIAEIASVIQFNHLQAQPQEGIKVVGDIENLDSDVFEALERVNAAWVFNWSDFASVMLTPKYFNVCKEDFQRTTESGVSIDVAAIYTKMNFLRDLGFITEEAYKTCIGDGKIGLQGSDIVTRNGFHRLDGDHNYRRDIDKIGHTIVHPDRDEKLFIIIGKGVLNDDGKQYNMQMQLRFNKTNGTNLPRGIYKLNWLWSPSDTQPCPRLFSSSHTLWTFFVNVEKAPSKSYCAVVGEILVTRSSKNFIEASMMINKLLKRVGGPPVYLPSPQMSRLPGGIIGLAEGELVPEAPNFKVYIRWKRE